MGKVGACCRITGKGCLLFVICFLAFFLPPVFTAANHVMFNVPLLAPVTLPFFALVQIRTYLYCNFDHVGCAKDEFIRAMVAGYGWGSPGMAYLPSLPYLKSEGGPRQAPMVYTHEGYKKISYDPAAKRHAEIFVMMNTSLVPAGALPEGVFPTLISLDTDDPERHMRRNAMAEVFKALGQHPPKFELVLPSGVSPSHYANQTCVTKVVAASLIKWMFAVDLSTAMLDELVFVLDTLKPMAVMSIFPKEEAAARMAAFWEAFEEAVRNGPIAAKYAALFVPSGGVEEGTKRLREVLLIALFAGIGGTSDLTFQTLTRLWAKAPEEHAALFAQDEEAYMIEAARLYPPVGGQNPSLVKEDGEVTLSNGQHVPLKAGDAWLIISSGSNKDPALYDDAFAFKPGRPNALRLLTWNAELGDIRSCDKWPRPCPKAPRGCPGTHASIRIATEAVRFFSKGIGATGATKGEL